MQVIVVDHAKLDTDDFREDIVEDWKAEEKYLIPKEWYTETENLVIAYPEELTQ